MGLFSISLKLADKLRDMLRQENLRLRRQFTTGAIQDIQNRAGTFIPIWL